LVDKGLRGLRIIPVTCKYGSTKSMNRVQ
jgi:hypothetical protein